MSVTPTTEKIKYMTECLHGSLLALAYPENFPGKWYTRQHVRDGQRALKIIRGAGEVNEMVYPILKDLLLLMEKAHRINIGEDPNQANLLDQEP